jgi:hypothetical protein
VLRDELAEAIINAAKFGERNPITLSAYAVAVGIRLRRLPSRRR